MRVSDWGCYFVICQHYEQIMRTAGMESVRGRSEAGRPVWAAASVTVLLHVAGLCWLWQMGALQATRQVISFSMLIAPLAASEKPVVQETAAQSVAAPVMKPQEERKQRVAKVAQAGKAVAASAAQEAVVAPVVPARYDAAYLHNSPPDYPYMARKLGEEGTVWLRVRVSAQGVADAVALKSSSGFERLDAAAAAAVRLWRFVPAEMGGEMMTAWVDVPVTFRLEAL